MKSSEELGDLIEAMVDARLSGDRDKLVDLFDELLTGPRGDVLNTAVVLAGTLAEDLRGTTPALGYHSMSITRVDDAGVSRPGDASDLPGHVATFMQMVVAIANGDKAMARDLFLGYCGEDGVRALSVLSFGLNEAIHQNLEDCPDCQDDGDLNEVAS